MGKDWCQASSNVCLEPLPHIYILRTFIQTLAFGSNASLEAVIVSLFRHLRMHVWVMSLTSNFATHSPMHSHYTSQMLQTNESYAWIDAVRIVIAILVACQRSSSRSSQLLPVDANITSNFVFGFSPSVRVRFWKIWLLSSGIGRICTTHYQCLSDWVCQTDYLVFHWVFYRAHFKSNNKEGPRDPKVWRLMLGYTQPFLLRSSRDIW